MVRRICTKVETLSLDNSGALVNTVLAIFHLLFATSDWHPAFLNGLLLATRILYSTFSILDLDRRERKNNRNSTAADDDGNDNDNKNNNTKSDLSSLSFFTMTTAASPPPQASTTAVPSSCPKRTRPPLTLMGTVSYNTILILLRHTKLPEDLVASTVASFLTIEPVRPNQVTVIGASSDRGDFPLANVLKHDEQTWWISDHMSMPEGKGTVYVVFEMNGGALCRVTGIDIAIPPLPQGPLSLRDFRIDYSQTQLNGSAALTTRGSEGQESHGSRMNDNDDGSVGTEKERWICHETHVCQSVRGVQHLEFRTPIDARRVRLVCLSNQVSHQLDGAPHVLFPAEYSCVGLYSVGFH